LRKERIPSERVSIEQLYLDWNSRISFFEERVTGVGSQSNNSSRICSSRL